MSPTSKKKSTFRGAYLFLSPAYIAIIMARIAKMINLLILLSPKKTQQDRLVKLSIVLALLEIIKLLIEIVKSIL